MTRKRFKPEEIVNKLREADVVLSKGQTVAQACKQIGVTGFTYYRWRREYGGMKTNQAKRLKELERENARLKRLSAMPRLIKPFFGRPPTQTSEPATEAPCRPTSDGLRRRLRKAGMPGAQTATRDAALSCGGP